MVPWIGGLMIGSHCPVVQFVPLQIHQLPRIASVTASILIRVLLIRIGLRWAVVKNEISASPWLGVGDAVLISVVARVGVGHIAGPVFHRDSDPEQDRPSVRPTAS